MINSYGSIYALGHKAVEGILEGPVEATEKIDGSQLSFGVIDGELSIRSKGQQLHLGADNGMFNLAVKNIETIAGSLVANWIYRGEFLMKPKHNTLCLSPETLVLTSDLSWVPVGDIHIDDVLIGFDENTPKPKTQRKLYPSIVQDAWNSTSDDCYRIIFSDGREVIATSDHKWLAHTFGVPAHHGWVSTKELSVGSKIRNIFKPWSENNSYEAGYLAAALDGEGSLNSRTDSRNCSSTQFSFTQRDNEMLSRVMEYLSNLGINYTGPYSNQKRDCKKLGIETMDAAIKFLGVCRPVRLNNWNSIWVNRSLPRTGSSTVIACEPIHRKLDVVDLTTSTRTFIANGFATHNCYGRVPINNIIIFDIERGPGSADFLRWRNRYEECGRIGLEEVPVFFSGHGLTFEKIQTYLELESILEGVNIEGVVVKNYEQFTEDKKVAKAKFVSPTFQERHQKAWKESNPTRTDVIEELIESLRTEARWRKGVQHLKEDGRLEGSPRDIGNLIKEVQNDVLKEEEDTIKDTLFRHFKGQIVRGVVRGLPDTYKLWLAEGEINGR